jgi:branched-chain amino acid transport system substrate-binding protein
MLPNIRPVRVVAFASLLACASIYSELASAQKKYDAGASDAEIKIGNIVPYSGPASAYGVIGKTEEAYFKMINDNGGIKGRKIKFISYDDGFSPPKAAEQVRKLVETDEVLLVFNSFGTPSNMTIQKYLNSKKVPQLFVGSRSSSWNDPTNFPWTMGWPLSYEAEGRIYAKYIVKDKPAARISLLYQKDAPENDLVRGFKDELGSKASSMIVAEASQESSAPPDQAFIQKSKSANADIFLNFLGAQLAIGASAAAAKIGWNPQQILSAASAGALGKDESIEFVTAQTFKTNDPQWTTDAGYKKWSEFMAKYMPDANRSDPNMVYGYSVAETLVHVLDKCGDNLTRENVMAQAANLKDVKLGMMLPGMTLNTGKTDFSPIKQAQMTRVIDGKKQAFGAILSGATCSPPKKKCDNDPNNCC